MSAKFSDVLLEKVLGPLKTRSFRIDGDQSAGAVGRYIERKLQVANQNQAGQPDDSEGELKTLDITDGLNSKTITICQITANEHKNFARTFTNSVVFNKMKRLLSVYFTQPLGKGTGEYVINRWTKTDLHYLDKRHQAQLEQDYAILVKWMKPLDYLSLTKGMKVPKTKYLTVTWCGSGVPVWKFKTAFVRILYGDSANPTVANEFDRMFTTI